MLNRHTDFRSSLTVISMAVNTTANYWLAAVLTRANLQSAVRFGMPWLLEESQTPAVYQSISL